MTDKAMIEALIADEIRYNEKTGFKTYPHYWPLLQKAYALGQAHTVMECAEIAAQYQNGSDASLAIMDLLSQPTKG